MGANDVCTSTIARMTTPATFATQFQSAIDTINANDPTAVVYVVSIPHIYQLWQIEHTNPYAYGTWWAAKICQSMLSTSNTDADRAVVDQRNRDLNGVLASLTSNAGPNFFWDNNATFNYNFVDSEVSHLDYFHPSLTGQNSLATVTWGAGPDAALAK